MENPGPQSRATDGHWTGLESTRRKCGPLWNGVRAVCIGWILCLWSGAAGWATAQDLPPRLEASAVEITAVAERSELNRATGKLTSTVELKAINRSGQRIQGPVQAPVRFVDPAGAEVTAGITVPGAQGGFGIGPWKQPFFDLSPLLANGVWEPGTSLEWKLQFIRSRTLVVTYEVFAAGRLNRPPVVEAGGPYRISTGETVSLAAVASDPDGDALSFEWRFADGGVLGGPQVQKAFASPGLHEADLVVSDGRGGEAVDRALIAVTPAGAFALGRTRVLDGNGHPLPSALVAETGPGGTRSFPAGVDTGFASLGGLPGTYLWKFSAPGHHPVWRNGDLPAGGVAVVPYPWLEKEREAVGLPSVLGQSLLQDLSGIIRLRFPAGAFSQSGRTLLTLRSGQSLPAVLPPGWSPVTAFSFVPPEPGASLEGEAELRLATPVPAGRVLAVVRYSGPGGVWKALKSLTSDGSAVVRFPLTQSGDYALVLADAAPAPVPGVPPVGEALTEVVLPSGILGALSATGEVAPPERSASEDPEAVTAAARVDFSHPGAVLPSGFWFPMEVEETYDLKNNAGRFRTPDYDATFFAWRGLGSSGDGVQLQAPFPLRPRLLLGGEVLQEARLKATILKPGVESLVVVDAGGGMLASGDLLLHVPAGAAGGLATALLRPMEPASFTALSGGFPIVTAFSLDFSNFLPGSVLEVEWKGPGKPGSFLVLARLVSGAGGTGLQPVLRLQRNTDGRVRSVEPATAPRLPGVDRAGQYVLLETSSPLGLVGGAVQLLAGGEPAAGAVVRAGAHPWLALTGTGGDYQLLAPAGLLAVTAVRDAGGLTGRAETVIPADLAPVALNVGIGSAAPFVLTVFPSPEAVGVPVVTPVRVHFSEGMQASTLVAEGAITLRDAALEAVPAGLSLDPLTKVATLLPANPLEAAATYVISLGEGLRDLQGLALEGNRQFVFTTAAPAARGEGAQLTLYEPGGRGPGPEDQALLAAVPGYQPGASLNLAVAIGSAGTADPGVAVVLVNETTGSTSTIVSKSDGSFANFIEAVAEDRISATFLNTNGTRITIPAGRQKFDDGRVGLFQQGGILEASNEAPGGEGDPPLVEVGIAPDAIQDRVVFQLRPVSAAQLASALSGSLPEAAVPAGGGVIASHESGAAEGRAEMEFALDPGTLVLPPGVTRAEDATFLLTSVQDLDGVLVYEVIDTMSFANGRLSTTGSPPLNLVTNGIRSKARTARLDSAGTRLKNVAEGLFEGLSFPDIVKKQFLADVQSVLEDLNFSSLRKMKQPNELLTKLGLPDVGTTVIHQLLLPVMLAQGTTTNIGGRVVAVKVDADGKALDEGKPVAGAVVTLERPPLQSAGKLRPGQLVTETNALGQFMMRMDVGLEGAERVLAATHPRFPAQRPVEANTVGNLAQRLTGNVLEGGASGGNVQLAKLSFVIPPAPGSEGVDESPPVLRASHAPVLPGTGIQPADPGAVLTLSAVDDRSISDLTARVLSAEAFSGSPMTPEEVRAGELETVAASAVRLEKQLRIQCARAGRVLLELSASDASGNAVTATYAIDFARPPLVPDLGGPEAGPRVLGMTPASGSEGHVAFPSVTLRFTKALPAAAFLPENRGWLVLDPQHFLTSMEPSSDRREVVMRISGLEAGPVSLTIGSPLTDEAGKPFDQNPEEEGAQVFTAGFELAVPPAVPLDLRNGGGAAMLGGYLFTLDRLTPGGAEDSLLVAWDISNPTTPRRVSATPIFGTAADLAVIPRWSWIPKPGDGPVTAPVVVVMSGVFGGEVQGFKTMRIFDVSRPEAPVPVARGNVSVDPVSQIVKVAVQPPFLVYQEMSSEVTSVRMVDLAAFILGHNATPEQRGGFPENPRPGLDLNGDGDYTDAGEQNALPARAPATFFGDIFSYAPETRDERIVDFSFGGRGLLGVITSRPAGGPAVFRNILAGSDPGNPAVGSLTFQAGEDPKRLTLLTALPVRVSGVRRLLDVALISLRADASGKPALLLLDVSDPASPRRLGQMPLEPGDGIPNSLIPRGGSLLVLTTSTNTLTLDSERLLETDGAGRSLAIVNRLPGLGSGVRSFVSDPSGVAAVAASGRNQVIFTGPTMEVITFPEAPRPALAISQLVEEDIAKQLAASTRASLLRRSAAAFGPGSGGTEVLTSQPDPEESYYVLCRVPGGAGGAPGLPGELELTLSSVSFAGGFPALDTAGVFPRLLVDEASRQRVLVQPTPPPGAWPVHFPAHRLSNSPVSPLYNVFLAGPFTLHQALPAARAQLLGAQLPQAFLRLDKAVYAGLAPVNPSETTFLDPFRPALGDGPLQPAGGTTVPCDFKRNPLIFVPGVMASRLRGTGTFDLWLSVPNLGLQVVFDAVTAAAKAGVLRIEVFGISIPFPPGVSIAAARYLNALNELSLGPQGQGGEIHAPDVLRDVFLAGETLPLERVQGPLLEYLQEELGYREYIYDRDARDNVFALEAAGGAPNRESLATLPDLYPFPYDWRLDNATNARRLAEYIELIREANPDVRNVDVLAHSMGGLITRRYMLDHPGVIDTFISACSPFLGAPKAANTLRTGDLGEFLLNFACGLELGKQISRHMPALHQLMPSQGYFDLGGRPVVERGWDADGDLVPYETLDYTDYRRAMDGQYVHSPPLTPPRPVAAANESFHFHGPAANNNQDNWTGDRSGTRIFHIVSATQKPETISRLRLMPRLIPSEPIPDLSLDLPSLEFEDREEIDSTDPLLPADGKVFPAGQRTFRLEYGLEVDRGMGDGTVPLLSQVRGFGSNRDLNAPGAVMLPLVSRDPRNDPDKEFSHAGMLKNQEFFRTLRGILLGETSASAQPELTLTMPGSGVEGTAVNLEVTVEGGPPGEEPTVVWDTGDGGFIIGRQGVHTWQEDGSWTVTCLVGFRNAPGAVISRQIVIGNVPPQVRVVTSGSASPGETVRFTAVATDPGGEDSLTYRWNFGDGSELQENGRFTETHAYALPGAYTVRVTVTDEDGSAVEATAGVTVSAAEAALLPVASLGAPAPQPASEFDDPPAVEFAQLVIGGHDVLERASPKVTHSGRSTTGAITDFVVDEGLNILLQLRTVQVAQLASSSVEMRLHRLDPAGSSNAPQSSTVEMEAAAFRMDIRLQHHRANGIVKCYEWQVATEPGRTVRLKIPWDTLDVLQEADLSDLTVPPAFAVHRIACRDTLPPAIAADFDAVDYQLRGVDLAVVDGAPEPAAPGAANAPPLDPTLFDQRPVMSLEAPRDSESSNTPAGSNAAQLDGVTWPEGSIVTEIESAIPRGTEPRRPLALLTQDGTGNLETRTEPIRPGPPVLTSEEAEAIRAAVRTAFTSGANHPFFKRFVVKHDHVRIFEQGTGAALWKSLPKAIQSYTPGVSDNDYELLLPSVITASQQLNPKLQADQRVFEEAAFTDRFMTGDWYFLPPQGVELIGNIAFPVPAPADRNDPQQMAAYLSRVQAWVYRVPDLQRTLDPQGAPAGSPQEIRIPKNTLMFSDPPEKVGIFVNPVTPADIISFVLTENVKRSPEVRAKLRDVSFFPFRREHFDFGVMSLERPPPFGDDPVGDAGMGRSLLLLKWVLEGAFVDAFGDFNVGVNDVEARTTAFEALRRRQDRLEPEGLEWGLYQEFSALAESAHLRVIPSTESGGPLPQTSRGVFGDYFSAHDKKIVRKMGKAAIRGVLARLATEDNLRSQLFALGPQAFDDDAKLPSFEHLVARLGRNNTTLFGGAEAAPLIDRFLAAKIGNPDRALDAILRNPDTVSLFLKEGFDFLRERVQVPTSDDYSVYLDRLIEPGASANEVAEHGFRTRNAAAVNFGIQPLQGALKPGRLALHGVGQGTSLKYKFALSLSNTSEVDPVTATVSLDPGLGGNPPVQTVQLQVPARGTIRFPDPDDPVPALLPPLQITRNSTLSDSVIGTIFLTSSLAEAEEKSKRDDKVFFVHDRLPLGVFVADGSGSLSLQLERVENPAAPTGDCFLRISLNGLLPTGGSGSALPSAVITAVDDNNQTHPVVNGRILLNRGPVRQPIQWPLLIVGSVGDTNLDSVLLDARLEEAFRTGALEGLSPPRQEFGKLLAALVQSPDNGPAGARVLAAALAPSVHALFAPLLQAPDSAALLNSLTPFQNVHFAVNSQRFLDPATGTARTVAEIVSNEGNASGLQLASLVPGVPQTSPIFLTLWNPGRNGKVGTRLFSNGQVFVHDDLRARAQSGQVLLFSFPNPGPTGSPALTALKVELFHELNFRLLCRALATEPNFNVETDLELVRMFPGFAPDFGRYFQSNFPPGP